LGAGKARSIFFEKKKQKTFVLMGWSEHSTDRHMQILN